MGFRVSPMMFWGNSSGRLVGNAYLCSVEVCHENKSAVCRVVVRNFRRDGSWPTAYGVQALFANHFMLL